MPTRIQVQPHVSVDELRSRYLEAADPVERTGWQAILLIAQGRSSGEVAEVTGRGVQLVQRIVTGTTAPVASPAEALIDT